MRLDAPGDTASRCIEWDKEKESGEVRKAGWPPELDAVVSFCRSIDVLVSGLRTGKARRVPGGWGSGEGRH